ncbi:hypothetical protein MMC26_004664 [Xylographa opegraphella]|nr:hypothetical protein [Xylographa opegraphella]
MASNGEPTIPVVDLSSFLTGGPVHQQQAADQLAKACRDLGFVAITGHGVSNELLQEAFDWSRKLFELSHEEKMKAPHPASSIPHRGYSPPGLEKVYSKNLCDGDDVEANQKNSLRKVADFKESYEIGSEENPSQPNIWLPEAILPGYRKFMLHFYWELNKSAQMILQAISHGLHLEEKDLTDLLHLHPGQNNQLRLLHYPPVPAELLENQIVARMPAHTDWSSFTLLFQDDCGGLELEDPRYPGLFIPATPMPNALVLNIGDMFQRISNDNFKTATHRVALPPLQQNRGDRADVTRARYSIPYFFAPNDDAVVSCLPSTVREDHPALYEPIMFKDYGAWRSKYAYQQPEVEGGELTRMRS